MRWMVMAWLAAGVAASGCGSSFEEETDGDGGSGVAPGPCNLDPWSCPDTQTCWVGADYTYQCLNQGPGGPGASCSPTLGTPQCAHDLACSSSDGVNGVCVPFCDNTDPARACPGGTLCQLVGFQNVMGTVNLCVP